MYKLIKVEPGENNNKFYNLTPKGSVVLAEWGRVGGHTSSKEYPLHKMDGIARSKMRKGYEDVTHLSVTRTGGEIKVDQRVSDLYHLLTSASKHSVSENYTYGSEGVTQVMIDEAQRILNSLLVKPKTYADIAEFNDKLVKLFTVIPRKMHKVSDFLYQNNYNDIITREQDSLDALAGQVSTQVETDTTLEDAYGISFAPITSADEKTINQLLGYYSGRVDKAWVVSNHQTEQKFTETLKTAKNKKNALLWHGSRNENWLSIVTKGLMIRPTNAVHTGSMFGDGIYFADKDRKSGGYSSIRGSYWAGGTSRYGMLAIYQVHQGNQMQILHHNHKHYSLSKSNLGPYDSVFAKGGADLINNEYIIYDGAQCTIKYLLKIV